MIQSRTLCLPAVLMAALLWSGVATLHASQETAQQHFSQGVSALQAGKGTEAAAQFSEALKINPDWTEAYINRGQAYVLQGKADQALKDFDKALAMAPEAYEALYNRGRVYTMLGKSDHYEI